MLLLQHGDEVGVSFGLARFINNFRQPRRLPTYFQPGHKSPIACRSIGFSQLMEIILLDWDGIMNLREGTPTGTYGRPQTIARYRSM